MKLSTTFIEQFVARLADWGERRPDVRAILVHGSQSQDIKKADEWSDLDLIAVTTEPKVYLDTADWLADLGHVWLTFNKKSTVGDFYMRRIMFEGALDVDWLFVPDAVAKRMGNLDPASGIGRTIHRGVRFLVDKDGFEQRLALAGAPPQPPITEAEFRVLVEDYLQHAVNVAKKLRRGELFYAKNNCDDYMKFCLLKLIEWHARVTRNWDMNSWQRGRYLERWADPRAVSEMGGTYSLYDAASTSQALMKSLDLFRWLAVEVAERLRFTYPAYADERVTEWIGNCLAEFLGAEGAPPEETLLLAS